MCTYTFPRYEKGNDRERSVRSSSFHSMVTTTSQRVDDDASAVVSSTDSLLENAPLLGGGAGGAAAPAAASSGEHHQSHSLSSYLSPQRMRVAATPLLVKAVVASLVITATMTGVAVRLAGVRPPDKYLVGLANDEGLGAMLSHIGCYAHIARATKRRLVVVPQYASPHYPDHPPGEPAMDYAKYVNFNMLAPGYVRWQDAPEPVRVFVRDQPDAILLANVMNRVNPVEIRRTRTPDDNADAAAATAARLSVLHNFRYGPDPEDYPHVSRDAWERYEGSRPCGGSYCDQPSLYQQISMINRRGRAEKQLSLIHI